MTQLNKPSETTQETNGIITTLQSAPKTAAAKSIEVVKHPVYHLRNNQIIAGISGTIGLVLFAFGIENLIGQIPQLSSPLTEVVLGLVLLSISGLFLKKLS